MKKLMWITVMLLSGLFAICMMQSNAISAAAVDFVLCYEQIEESDWDYNDVAPHLDEGKRAYRVTVSVYNNTGMAGGGLRVEYNSDIGSLVHISDKDVVWKAGPALSDFVQNQSFNEEKSYFGVGFFATEDSDNNGELFYFYLQSDKDKETVDKELVAGLVVTSLWDYTTDPVPSKPPVTPPGPEQVVLVHYRYLCGDINGDGRVDIADIILLQNFVKLNSGISVDAEKGQLANGTVIYDGFWIETDIMTLIFTVESADVNKDGVIDQADVDLFLAYYSDVIVVEGSPALYPYINAIFVGCIEQASENGQ